MMSSANNISEDLLLEVDPDFFDGQSRMSEGTENGTPAVLDSSARQVIRTGKYEYEVKDLDSARAQVLRLVRSIGGYIDGEELNDWSDRKALVLRLRIPSKKLDGAITALHALGELKYQSLTAEDVTASIADTEARMRSKRELERRYLDLIARAAKVSELLELERALESVRAEVESMEAQLKTMQDQVAMSTLRVTCSVPKSTAMGFWSQMGDGFTGGWRLLLAMLVGLARIWPVLLLIVGAIWIMVARRKRSRT
ncbi:MAG: DUF4349 domain-containing protein [Flavobacteriales bacterium]|nr:DUF4349 domain-containing protein [Flavobacteriales bacterium]